MSLPLPGEKEHNPITTARELSASLDENTRAVKAVRNRYRIIVVFLVMLLVVFGYAVDGRRDNDLLTCLRANDLRRQINVKFDSLAAAITPEPGATPQQIESNRQFAEMVREDIEPRDCTEVSWF